MTTQELKQQANKEFDEKCKEVEFLHGVPVNLPNYYREKIKSFLDSIIDRTVQQTEERIVGMIINAGQNKISMLDPDTPRCEVCLNGFTGTYWISQNDLIFALTGKYLSEYKESLITNKSDINK